MSSSLTHDDIKNKVDPSVARQLDNDAPIEEKFKDFYSIVDSLKITMFSTYRPNIGPVTRSMAVAKRTGPDFLFLANNHSQKFKDLSANKEVNLAFRDSTNQSWISVTGEATTTDNKDPRIEKVWNRGAAAWFGDLGDGVHDGSPTDPRLTLIEIKPKYISYYKAEAGAIGYLKEVVVANVTGGVANTGKLREMSESDIKSARARDSELSS